MVLFVAKAGSIRFASFMTKKPSRLTNLHVIHVCQLRTMRDCDCVITCANNNNDMDMYIAPVSARLYAQACEVNYTVRTSNLPQRVHCSFCRVYFFFSFSSLLSFLCCLLFLLSMSSTHMVHQRPCHR